MHPLRKVRMVLDSESVLRASKNYKRSQKTVTKYYQMETVRVRAVFTRGQRRTSARSDEKPVPKLQAQLPAS